MVMEGDWCKNAGGEWILVGAAVLQEKQAFQQKYRKLEAKADQRGTQIRVNY